ncbi:AraC family transcriptional regulator [Rhizobium sp. KVB221]|uniref:AraC family transcriptional regulator n=1 Tax=Rhizobium setariae TaxID=2801340 RepID=A0A936YR02_9HYPH|nr:AraC family transcriptional regulator [Rhizobium setariae]MBL0371206.1 AraC family transcriptional regulator [Rhizobium setariae]
MHSVSQRQATDAMPVTTAEKTSFWRDRRFRNMECMSATFITHEFAPHAHDTFSIGAIEAGCQIASIRGAREYTGPGALYLLNPGEIHDGTPGAAEGYRYRMIYPDVELFTSILEDVKGKTFHGVPSFSRQLLHDQELARAFHFAHRAMEAGCDPLEAEVGMFRVLASMFARYGSVIIAPPKSIDRTGLRRARDYLADNFQEDVGLERLSEISGLSRAHLIRAFRKEYFITPHAFQTDIRIRQARRMLRSGMTPSDTALCCGFADQAHFTRNFKARTGITPAAYRNG